MERKLDNLSNVVSLDGREARRTLAPLKMVEAYWHALRGARDIPLRSDIDPRGIENALEYAFIAERVTAGMARFRVSGCHLNDLTGMPLVGMPLHALLVLEDRDRLASLVAQLFDEPAIVRLSLQSPAGFGQPEMTAEMLLMPLRSDVGGVDRVLGCLVSTGRIGRTPRRLAITAAGVEPVTRAAAQAPVTRLDAVPAIRLPQQPDRPLVRPERRSLVLVVDNG